MMMLWLLSAREDVIYLDRGNPWKNPYDRIYGMVVQAETEEQARSVATEEAGAEIGWADQDGTTVYLVDGGERFSDAWTNPRYSTCVQLRVDQGPARVLYRSWG